MAALQFGARQLAFWRAELLIAAANAGSAIAFWISAWQTPAASPDSPCAACTLADASAA